MFTSLGRFVTGHARAVLVGTLLLLVGAGFLGFGVFGKLQDGGFTDPAAESSRAAELAETAFDGGVDLVILVRAKAGTVDSPEAAAAGDAIARDVAREPGVTTVTSYWETRAPTLRTDDGRYALVLVNGGDGEELVTRYRSDADPAVEVSVGGPEAASADIADQIGRDLGLAEGIAVPIILLLLVFAFRTVVAALLPLAVGMVAIFGTFALLSVLASATNVSIYAVNLTTALGLGLAVDYALLIVSRFREELTEERPVADAVVTTMATAGRTIVFSAATVAAALAVLMVFPLYFLRSFAYAAVGVVAISTVAALLVLPALLTVLGRRVDALRLPWASRPAAEAPIWGRLAGLVWRRPLLTALPVVAALAVAALPLLRVEFGTPDDRVLPASADSRQVGDVRRTEFDTDGTTALQLISTGPMDRTDLAAYANRLAELPGVARVESSAGVFTERSVPVTTPMDSQLSGPTAERLAVVSTHDPGSTEAKDLVGLVRAVPTPAGTDVLVGGLTAELVDTLHAIGSRLPLAIGIIVLTTMLLLLLFTGSVVQPLRSLVLNSVTLAATLGAMVFVFQEGHLASLLGFTPQPLDTSMLLLLFCVAFGLSMDYEVFVLSRVKELRDQGADNRTAMTTGLARTGRIVSMAAVLLAVNFFAFGTAQISFLQLFGLGTGLAILIDATLVRGILMPACLRLLGRVAWWAPPRLRLLHRRVGLVETS